MIQQGVTLSLDTASIELVLNEMSLQTAFSQDGGFTSGL